jgi:hypothetical protein
MPSFDDLPQNLRDSAYRFGNESAWQRKEALEVIDFLSRHAIPVSRIEVWLATFPGPTIPMPFFYHWPGISRDAEIDGNHHAAEVNKQAREFIEDFEWDERDQLHAKDIPFFNIASDES